jgi:hypothetical protein
MYVVNNVMGASYLNSGSRSHFGGWWKSRVLFVRLRVRRGGERVYKNYVWAAACLNPGSL